MQRSIPPSGSSSVAVLGIMTMGRGDLGLVVPVMASGCLGTWVLLRFCWVMMHTLGGGKSYSGEKKQGFTLSNSMVDRQVQVFGKNLEGKKMTASRDVHALESLGENEGVWEAACKYKPHA